MPDTLKLSILPFKHGYYNKLCGNSVFPQVKKWRLDGHKMHQ